MSTKLIYFVRHGKTENNAQHIRQGEGGSLNEEGREQALATAKRFPKEKGKPEVIITSPYQRAKETAEIIAAELGMGIEFSNLLVERKNPSAIVGHKGDEKEVQEIIDRIDKSFHPDYFRLADEENFLDLKARAQKLLEYIISRKEKRIIMVTHSIFLKMVASYIIHGENLTAAKYNTLSYLNSIDNGGMTICSYTSHWFKKGEWKLIVWNDLIDESSD